MKMTIVYNPFRAVGMVELINVKRLNPLIFNKE